MAGSKVHMLVYPYGLCIRLELLSSLCSESLHPEVSSRLEREKWGFCHSLVIPSPPGQFSKKRSIFHWNCDQRIFFCCCPVKQKFLSVLPDPKGSWGWGILSSSRSLVTLITPVNGAQTFLWLWNHPGSRLMHRTELLMARACGNLWVDKEIEKKSEGL